MQSVEKLMHPFRPKTMATALLIGTIVGAGFLGIPYVVARSGFLLGLIHIIVIGAAVMTITLYLAEIALRTKERHQLPGYAEKYLGTGSKILMLIATIGGIYSALMAYLIGEGHSLSYLLTGSTENALPALLIVWLIFACITHRKKDIGKSEMIGVALMLLLMVVIIGIYTPKVQIENLTSISFSNALLPFGLILFAFLGFSAIPEMKMMLAKAPRVMRRLIMTSYLLIAVLYACFTLVVLGSQGERTPEIATLALGKPFILLSIITLATAYLALALALIDTLVLDCRCSRNQAWLLANAIPLLLVLVLASFNKAQFTLIMSIGGILSGTLTALLILAMLPRARRANPDASPPLAPYNLWLTLLLIIIFIGGALAELLSLIKNVF